MRDLGPQGAAQPGSRTVAVGNAYLSFARQSSAQFGLMFSEQIDHDDLELDAARIKVWKLLYSMVKIDSDCGMGRGVSASDLALMAWSIVHGISTLQDISPFSEIDSEKLLSTLNRAIVGAAERERPPVAIDCSTAARVCLLIAWSSGYRPVGLRPLGR